MKVSKNFVLRMLCAASLTFAYACSSDQEEVEEGVQPEGTEETAETAGEGETSEAGFIEEDSAGEAEDFNTDDSSEIVSADASADAEYGSVDSETEALIDESAELGDTSGSYGMADETPSMAFEEPTKPAPVVNYPAAQSAPTTPAKTYVASEASLGNITSPTQNAKNAYVVQHGDTLSTISRRLYGNSAKWHELAQVNGLANPHRIYPGDTLFYKSSSDADDFAAAFDSVPKHYVTVSKGDTLTTLAGKVLGNSNRWKVLWGYNWKNIKDPNHIFAGQKLWYVKSSDMANFLAAVDGGSAEKPKTAQVKPAKVIQAAPAAETKPAPVVVEEPVEELPVAAETPAEEEAAEVVPATSTAEPVAEPAAQAEEVEVQAEDESALEEEIIEDIEVDQAPGEEAPVGEESTEEFEEVEEE